MDIINKKQLFRTKNICNMTVLLIVMLGLTACQPNPNNTAISQNEYVMPSLVVAVTDWRHEGGPKKDIQEETYLRLKQRFSENSLQSVSLEKIPATLNNAAEVDLIAGKYNAEILVWGWYDETAVRGYVDLANAVEQNGMANSLAAFLRNGGSTESIRVLNILGKFDYEKDGVNFCVPRWSP